jgi:hemolysin III
MLRTRTEEFVSSFTHGIGFLLSIIGGYVLLSAPQTYSNKLVMLGCYAYIATLVLVYAISTMSHMYLFQNINIILRKLDQGCIYLLIVGTGAPFLIALCNHPLWIWFYIFIVTIAIVGFLSKTIFSHRLNNVALSLYILLGWGEAVGIIPLWEQLSLLSIFWLVVGGVLYTVGTIFLLLDLRKYYFHAIWHLFVIAGSISHFISIKTFTNFIHNT